MTLTDRNLREQTLFALYKNPPVSDTEAALRESLAQVTNKIYETKGEWTRKKMLGVQREIGERLGVNYKKLQKDLPKDLVEQVDATSLFKLDRSSVNNITKLGLVQGYTPDELFKTVEANHVRKLKTTLAAGVARGAPVNEIVKSLQDANSSITKTQLKSAVITVQNEARAATRHDNYHTLEAKGLIEGYVYNATLDGKTSEYCRDHDGRTYWKPIKEISNQINVHFRCRSVFVPTTKNSGVRASMHGPVENQSYGNWFGKQDVDFQRTVLGNKTFKLYQEGRYKVGGLPDVMVGESLAMEQISQMIGNMNFDAVESGAFNIKPTRADAELLLVPETRFREAYDKVDNLVNSLNEKVIAMRKVGKSLGLSDMEINTTILQTNEFTVKHLPKFVFQEVNNQLRGVSTALRSDQLDSYVRVLNNVLDKLPKKKLDTLYRGVNFSTADMNAHAVGKTVTYDAFTSTSATLEGSLDGTHTLVIKPSKLNGGYLGNFSTHPHETEFLYKPGTKFKVTKIDDVEGRIYLEEL